MPKRKAQDGEAESPKKREKPQVLANPTFFFQAIFVQCPIHKSLCKITSDHHADAHLIRVEGGYKCGFCDYTHKMKSVSETHSLKLHSTFFEQKCTFEGCELILRDVSSLNRHLKKHFPEEVYCSTCNNKFKDLRYLAVHVKKVCKGKKEEGEVGGSVRAKSKAKRKNKPKGQLDGPKKPAPTSAPTAALDRFASVVIGAAAMNKAVDKAVSIAFEKKRAKATKRLEQMFDLPDRFLQEDAGEENEGVERENKGEEGGDEGGEGREEWEEGDEGEEGEEGDEGDEQEEEGEGDGEGDEVLDEGHRSNFVNPLRHLNPLKHLGPSQPSQPSQYSQPSQSSQWNVERYLPLSPMLTPAPEPLASYADSCFELRGGLLTSLTSLTSLEDDWALMPSINLSQI